MKAVSVLRPAAWAGVIALVLSMQAALAEPLVYVPLGGEGKVSVHYSTAKLDEVNGVIDRMRKGGIDGRVFLEI